MGKKDDLGDSECVGARQVGLGFSETVSKLYIPTFTNTNHKGFPVKYKQSEKRRNW